MLQQQLSAKVLRNQPPVTAPMQRKRPRAEQTDDARRPSWLPPLYSIVPHSIATAHLQALHEGDGAGSSSSDHDSEAEDCLGLGLDLPFDIDSDFFGEPCNQPEQMELNDGWLNAVLLEAKTHFEFDQSCTSDSTWGSTFSPEL